MDDKSALVTNSAGIRLIAQQTLLNKGDFERLRNYIDDNYTGSALDTQSAVERQSAMQSLMEQAGKLRVAQVLGIDKYKVIILMEAQRDGGFYMTEIAVEADYPHRVSNFSIHPLES